MNKEQLTALVAEILGQIEPQVKGSDYKPTCPGPMPTDNHHHDGDFVPDITELDLRKLYPEAKIYGHHDFEPSKLCPCFDAKTEYKDM